MMRIQSLFKSLRQHKRRWIALFLLLILGSFGVFAAPRLYSAIAAQGQIYTLASVPDRPVAIAFGAEVLASGRLSASRRKRDATDPTQSR